MKVTLKASEKRKSLSLISKINILTKLFSVITLMILFTIILARLFILTNHPLSIRLSIVVHAMNIALISGTVNHSFWFSYMIFLIIVGGMLVLFIYITSIASNEKFQSSWIPFTTTALILTLATIIANAYDPIIWGWKTMYSPWTSQEAWSLRKFLNYPSRIILTVIIVYLLIALIAVVKISRIQHGPLREKF